MPVRVPFVRIAAIRRRIDTRRGNDRSMEGKDQARHPRMEIQPAMLLQEFCEFCLRYAVVSRFKRVPNLFASGEGSGIVAP